MCEGLGRPEPYFLREALPIAPGLSSQSPSEQSVPTAVTVASLTPSLPGSSHFRRAGTPTPPLERVGAHNRKMRHIGDTKSILFVGSCASMGQKIQGVRLGHPP